MLPFCNYLNHSLLAWFPHGQFVPSFLPLPSHSSEACSDLTCSTELLSHLSSQHHRLDLWGRSAEQPLTPRSLHNCTSSPCVCPPFQGRRGVPVSHCRRRLCWLVGLGYTQDLPQHFTHLHELGLPRCCRSRCFPRHSTGCLAALHLSKEGIFACSSAASIPSCLNSHTGLRCHEMPEEEFTGKWNLKPLLQHGHPTDLASQSPTVSPALTEFYHLKAT